LMADLAVIDKHRIAAKSRVRNTNDKEAGKMFDILDRLWRAMRDEKKNASDIGLSVEEILLLRPFGFLTLKPVLFVVNVGESGPFDAAMWTQRLGGNAVPVCIRGEAELADIVNIQEREDFRAQLGMGGSLDWVIRGCYESLGLRTFYTFGKGITRAWPVYPGATAIDAAGMIHTDFLQTFSRAQILSFNDLCAHGEQYVRDRGLFQTVGRNYELCDGDVVWIVADTI
ncbi:MAG: DUF933 domain-containing protein, partial [bacterium]|nr:DUF933 domain-containing protein [bacterium]